MMSGANSTFNVHPSQCSLQSGQTMSLAKTLQVQDQIIEQLRKDQIALREALEIERSTLKDCRLTSDRELKALQREKFQISKVNKQQEVKIEELEKELTSVKEALAFEQKNLKTLEKEHVSIVKELKLKSSKDFEKNNKQEILIDQLKSEVDDLKEALQSERNATNLLIREHNAEVKMLREEVRNKSTEAYRELKERATREREEYREMQEEAEKTYNLLEKDFRDALAAKDEEIKKVKAEAKLIQKELEDQLRASLKEPSPVHPAAPLGTNDFIEMAKFRRLKNEVAILKEQNRKLLNELQNDVTSASPTIKPAVPRKPLKLMTENGVGRTTHVKDMIRRLQERESTAGGFGKGNVFKMGAKMSRSLPIREKDDADERTSIQTLEDLRAIDEDIEKLRKQIEERDKIISALREAAEAKDKKLEHLMVELSKAQRNDKLDANSAAETHRATLSSPSSPPLCNGELCWTDNFVNKNYHEPVYAQLLNDHTALQRICNELQTKLETKRKEFERMEEDGRLNVNEHETKMENHENAINLIMAEQIRILKEREAQLISEAEELKEQNDLMEFRILELEECRKEFLDKGVMDEEKHRTEKIVWSERDVEDISDSGVMSLPTSEDLTSDSELGDTIRNYSPLGATNLNLPSSETPAADFGSSDFKIKKSVKSPSECLQESGIFEDIEIHSGIAIAPTKQTRGCQTESVLDKTLLDFIDSSCDLLVSKSCGYLNTKHSDDLSTEISKLSVIQKRIQQKTKSPLPKGPHTVLTCPHTNSVLFYEGRLAQLEDKLRIYESSDDTKDVLLAKRLQKEIELAHRVKELTETVTTLQVTNRQLEEEKCEFEEAENDTRFQCQRLEIRLQELISKNTDLELELERQKIRMSEERRRDKKKGSLETLINRYEQRNFELEEREVEAKQRLGMIEAAMPAIVAWNVFRIVQSPEFVNMFPGIGSREAAAINGKVSSDQDEVVFQRLEELLDDQKKLRRDYEKVEESAADREKALRRKIEELELKAAKDREVLEEMTNSLKALKSEERCSAETSNIIRPEEVDLLEELKTMVANEIQLRAEIERLEKKEQAYMDSLEKADEIWASMEADYKKRLMEAETASEELQKRVSQLETTQMELEKALQDQPIPTVVLPTTRNEVNSKIEELMQENEKLKMELTRSIDRKFDEHKKFLETENTSLRNELKKIKSDFVKEEKKYVLLQKELEVAKEEAFREREKAQRLKREVDEKSKSVNSMEITLQNQISDLTHELSRKGKELSNLEVTVAELKEEVETLENKVAELVETIQTSVSNQDEGRSSKNSCTLAHSDSTERELVRRGVAANGKKPAGDTSAFAPFREVLWVKNEIQPEEDDPTREEEIFQLNLKNTELQQLLERMEEESRVKEKELEELQKIALEIRREQQSLELLYEAEARKHKAKIEESPVGTRGDDGELDAESIETTRSVDVLDLVNPIVVKTSYPVSAAITDEQTASGNFEDKCPSRGFAVKPSHDESQQKGDNPYSETLDRSPLSCSDSEANSKQTAENMSTLKWKGVSNSKKPRSSTPNNLGRSSSASYSMLATAYSYGKHFGQKAQDVDENLSYVAAIRTMRKVGENEIFLEWDVSHRPNNVTGYEILVNGMPSHRVRSSSRNKALLHSLDLNERILIQIFATSDRGRSIRYSHVTYPDCHLVYRTESL